MIEEQLTPVRRYTRAEAAQALNIPETWLKRWVTARCIPHQRSGDPNGKQQRGVWFTWDDILAIGAMLPELTTKRQTVQAARVSIHPNRRTRGDALNVFVVQERYLTLLAQQMSSITERFEASWIDDVDS